MRSLAIALAQVNIEDKLKSAPDENYQIGVLLGLSCLLLSWSVWPIFYIIVLKKEKIILINNILNYVKNKNNQTI